MGLTPTCSVRSATDRAKLWQSSKPPEGRCLGDSTVLEIPVAPIILIFWKPKQIESILDKSKADQLDITIIN